MVGYDSEEMMPEDPQSNPDLGRLRVLVVEDNFMLARALVPTIDQSPVAIIV